MKMVSIRMPPELWERVQRKAHAQGHYGSEITVDLLAKWDAETPDPPPVAPPKRGRKPAVAPEASA